MFENRVLRKVFGSKWEDAAGDSRKIQNEEPRNLHSSPNSFQVMISRRMRRVGHVICMGDMRNSYRILAEPARRGPCGNPACRLGDIIKIMSNKYDWREWTALKHQNKPRNKQTSPPSLYLIGTPPSWTSVPYPVGV